MHQGVIANWGRLGMIAQSQHRLVASIGWRSVIDCRRNLRFLQRLQCTSRCDPCEPHEYGKVRITTRWRIQKNYRPHRRHLQCPINEDTTRYAMYRPFTTLDKYRGSCFEACIVLSECSCPSHNQTRLWFDAENGPILDFILVYVHGVDTNWFVRKWKLRAEKERWVNELDSRHWTPSENW